MWRGLIPTLVVTGLLLFSQPSPAVEGVILGPPMGENPWRLTYRLPKPASCDFSQLIGEFASHRPLEIGYLKLPDVDEGAPCHLSFINPKGQQAPVEIMFLIGERTTVNGSSVTQSGIPVVVGNISEFGELSLDFGPISQALNERQIPEVDADLVRSNLETIILYLFENGRY